MFKPILCLMTFAIALGCSGCDGGGASAADSSAASGDVAVEIVRVTAGTVRMEKLVGDGEMDSPVPLLRIELSLLNKSSARKVDYRSWRGDGIDPAERASLTDDLGNIYKRYTIAPVAVPVGAVRAESVYPGKSIGDVLLFEMPVEAATTFTLELPGENVGQERGVRVAFPASMIQREQK